MPFKVIISSDKSHVFKKCIESVDFRVDTPNDAHARSTEIGNIIEINGKIGTEESTVDLYLWSLLPANDSKSYKKVEVQVIGHQGLILRKVTFPNAFIVDYAESYTSYDGNGSFYLLLRQKKDKNDAINLEGDTSIMNDEDDEENAEQ
ncbi:MAG TPA: membrane-associated protease 1 [Bacillota bacterium]|nr:membrane-associated protease 1 [Bacillota bacterium]